MVILSSSIISYAELAYKEGQGITKDRFGDTELTAMEAMNSEHRVCIVNPRNIVAAVNKALYEFLRSEGFDVPVSVSVGYND